MTSVAIIGGYGGMGRLFARVLKRNGFKITIAGPRLEKGRVVAKDLGVAFENDNVKAAKDADIVIITVPITKTLSVIKEVAPVMKNGSLLMDLTSVKEAPCEAMLKAAPAGVEVVGCHPVFGPMTPSFDNQNFVLCPLRVSSRFKGFKKVIRKNGARITECSPKEHDEAMGVVQGMTHFMLISAGAAMRDMGVDLKNSRRVSSPVYDLVLDLVGRLLGQDPRLYAEIQLENKETKKARKAFLEAAKRIDRIVAKGNEEAFAREMATAAEHYGDVTGALERTQRILKK